MPARDDLTRLAFRVLEDALAQANHRPVQRTWGHKLALAWIAQTGITLPWHCNAFWQYMVEPYANENAGYQRYLRTSHLTGLLDNWYRKLGWNPPDCVQRGEWARLAGTGESIPRDHDPT